MSTLRVLLGGLLLAMLHVGTAHAEDRVTGRLFFTPEQRARLDAARLEMITGRNRPPPVAATPEVPRTAPPQVVTLHGVVNRSDGESTVWVNGKAVSRRFADADIRAGSISSDSVGFEIPGSNRRIRLKVGQSVEATSGTIEEGYRRRRTLPNAAVPVESTTGAAAGDGGEPRSAVPARRRRTRDDEAAGANDGGDS